MSWDRWIRTVEVEPSLYAADFARLGDQVETLLRAGARAKARGFQVGLAVNPETAIEDVPPRADGFDLVLCMSIHPGYSGQEFMPDALERIRRLRAALPPGVHVQVDGGITA